MKSSCVQIADTTGFKIYSERYFPSFFFAQSVLNDIV